MRRREDEIATLFRIALSTAGVAQRATTDDAGFARGALQVLVSVPHAVSRGKAAPYGEHCRAGRARCWPARHGRVRKRARGLSSVGRAVALQASGQRFDPVRLHHLCSSSGCASVTFVTFQGDGKQFRPCFRAWRYGGLSPALTL